MMSWLKKLLSPKATPPAPSVEREAIRADKTMNPVMRFVKSWAPASFEDKQKFVADYHESLRYLVRSLVDAKK